MPLASFAQDVPPTFEPVVVTLRVPDAYATEPCVTAVVDNGVFVLARNSLTNIDLPVRLEISGTASNGVDYVKIPETITIPKGRWAAEVRVSALRDALDEGVENVIVRVVPPVCVALYPPPPECYKVGQPAEGALFIRDCLTSITNKPPMARITAPTEGMVFAPHATIGIVVDTFDPDGYCTKAEFFAGTNKLGERTRVFTDLTAPTNGQPIKFDFSWQNVPAGKYALWARVTDNKGAAGVSQEVHVGVGDRPVTNTLPLVSIVATDPIAIEGTNCWSWWSLTNRYADASALLSTYSFEQRSSIWWYTNCGPKNAAFAIRREGATNQDLRVFFYLRGTATNGVDYELVENSVVIPAGARQARVLIVPKEDSTPEPVETVIAVLAPPPYMNPLPPPYKIVRPEKAGAVIVDSSRPRLPIGVLPDRCFYLGQNAPDGSWARIERSTNMLNWEVICTNQVVQGAVHFVDPDADQYQQQYYRAATVSAPTE